MFPFIDILDRLPFFDGDRESASDFLSTFEYFVQMCKWQPAVSINILKARLRGNARVIAENHPVLFQILNWEEFKFEFLNLFKPDCLDIEFKFRNTIQGSNEKVQEYAYRILKFKSMLMENSSEAAQEMVDQQLKCQFIKGILHCFKRAVLVGKPRTFSDAIDLAANEELIQEQLREISKYRNSLCMEVSPFGECTGKSDTFSQNICLCCGQYGHLKEYCPDFLQLTRRNEKTLIPSVTGLSEQEHCFNNFISNNFEVNSVIQDKSSNQGCEVQTDLFSSVLARQENEWYVEDKPCESEAQTIVLGTSQLEKDENNMVNRVEEKETVKPKPMPRRRFTVETSIKPPVPTPRHRFMMESEPKGDLVLAQDGGKCNASSGDAEFQETREAAEVKDFDLGCVLSNDVSEDIEGSRGSTCQEDTILEVASSEPAYCVVEEIFREEKSTVIPKTMSTFSPETKIIHVATTTEYSDVISMTEAPTREEHKCRGENVFLRLFSGRPPDKICKEPARKTIRRYIGFL